MQVMYIRVSSEAQNTARQEEAARQYKVDKVFIEKQSGKNTERKALKEMLNFLREGDTLIVESISRLARNTKDLLSIIEVLQEKQVNFISRKENIDTNTAAGKFMLTVFGAMAELERQYILDRQAEGIAIAKSEGKYKGKPKKNIDREHFEKVCKQWRQGDITAVKAMQILNLKPATFYRRVKEWGL